MSDDLMQDPTRSRRHRVARTAATAGVIAALFVGGTWGLGASAQDDGAPEDPPPAEEGVRPEREVPEEMQAFKACMEEQGIVRGEPGGERPDREAVEAAREACEDLLPPPPTEEEIAAFRQCMADNGVNLPEPPAEGERPERLPEGERPDRETMQAAHEACEDLAPVGLHGPGLGGRGHGPGGHGPCRDGEGDAPTPDDAPAPDAPAEEPSVEGSSFDV